MHLQYKDAIGFAVAVEGRLIQSGGCCRDVGVDFDLQFGLEARHDSPVLLHVSAEDHLNHHLS